MRSENTFYLSHYNNNKLEISKISTSISAITALNSIVGLGIKLNSNKSPWFSLLTPGSINTVPISHGEGKLVCDKKLLKQLLKSGQIPTQYVDLSGSSTMAMPFNPNGSVSAIESMTNEDGTILGKMAHSERIGEHLYKNVNGEFDQKIFEAGVRYFNWGKK